MTIKKSPILYDHLLDQLNRTSNDAGIDLRRRLILLRKLEKTGPPDSRRVVMYYSGLERALSPHDFLPFASMLKKIGKVENMDLIVHSPGGDGLTAEKMMDLCRKHCAKKLRVAVPFYAKSAATLMALGADEIIMGETSELGPIDAQLSIIQDGAEQQVSADHYLRAESEAIKTLASGSPEAAEAARIHLANMSPAFLQYCRDSQDFAKDYSRKQLKMHMFLSEHVSDTVTWDARIDKIVDNLTASSKRLSHGRMITAAEIKADADLTHLKVVDLPEDDPYWLTLLELLLRTDVVAKSQEFGKVLFADGFHLVAG
jgi:Serine dehydrogenase proteinase